MPKNYNTRQKKQLEEIIEVLGSSHFTAEDVFEAIKKQGKNVGLTTIYRHLDKMVNEGILRKYLSGAGESACYQAVGDCTEHFHLKCTKCGKLVHLTCKSLDIISDHVLKEHGFSIVSSKTVFFGVCKECAQ